jgi:Anti-sigma-K factor rskA
MLTRPSEDLEFALGRLTPSDRALVELSFRRGISDDEIAGLMRVERDEVERRRGAALDQLGQDVQADSRSDLLERLAESWTNGDGASPNGAPEARSNGAALSSAVAARVRRPRPVVVGAVLVGVAAAAIALVIAGGGSGEKTTRPAAPARPASPSAGATSAPVTPVGGSGAVRGTVQLTGSTLHVRASGLGKSRYTVWLYNSVEDAAPVGNLHGGRLDVRLPGGFRKYRFVDVSREPADRNPNHSGASVLRAPLSSLH